VDLTASATALAAAMLFPCAPLPFSLVVPSFNTNIGVCPPIIFFYLHYILLNLMVLLAFQGKGDPLYMFFYIMVSVGPK
jgi:hypothetical protein